MAITATVDVITNALWPQGDIRDPLGVWGYRVSVTGDASGGSVKVVARAAAGESAAYLYTAYSVLIAGVTVVAIGGIQAKVRLLTNWPNVDPDPGVQAYAMAVTRVLNTDADFTAPELVPNSPFLSSNDRFLLLFDPRPSALVLDIVEMELGTNVLADVYSFEGYGYYWDRSILNAPGGPRHPGSS